MRVVQRHLLALLVIPGAVFLAGAPAVFSGTPAHLAGASTAHATMKVIPRACPFGTNWDNVLQRCV